MPRAILPMFALLAVMIALLAGTTFGYLVKSPASIAGPTQYIVVPVDQTSPDPTGCQFQGGHKGC